MSAPIKLPLALILAALAVGMVLSWIVVFSGTRVHAAASAGLHSTLATTSSIVVGTANNQVLFAADSDCITRVISTVGQPIMLSFDALSSTTLSGTNGHLQAASTTVAYDSALYGCGLWTAYGFNASTTITKSEFQ